MAVGSHERPRPGVVLGRLRVRLAVGAKPDVEHPERAGGEHDLEPEVGDPVQMLAGLGAHHRPCRQRHRQPSDERPQAGRIPGRVEPSPLPFPARWRRCC